MSSFSKVEVSESQENKNMETRLAESNLGRDAEKTHRDVKFEIDIHLPPWLGGGSGIHFEYENKKHDSSDVETSS